MITLSSDELRAAFGLGVAGNFAGHLEQAGEAADFVDVVAASAEAPKGIFPWYAPGVDGFLGTFPVSTERIELPASDEPLNLQIEPEAGVLFDVEYGADGAVSVLRPRALGAFNDCSIRRPGATKISHKKNWGPASKGLAGRLFPIDHLDPRGVTAPLRLASFLVRDGEAHAYGIDSPLVGYSYYGATRPDGIVDRLRHQAGSPGTPLEDVGALMAAAGSPRTALVGIGATRYTALGESTFLEPGDRSVVVVYDGSLTGPDVVAGAVASGREDALPRASVLNQRVVAAA